MKVLAITSIPSGVSLKKNGLRFLEAILIDGEGAVQDQYQSGFINLPVGLVNDLDDASEAEVSYSDAAANFNDFLAEIDRENDREVVIVLNGDRAWVDAFLSYNGFNPLALGEDHIRNIIDYRSWISGVQLLDPAQTGDKEFETSLELAEAFLNANRNRYAYKRSIVDLTLRRQNEDDDASRNIRGLMSVALFIGIFIGSMLV